MKKALTIVTQAINVLRNFFRSTVADANVNISKIHGHNIMFYEWMVSVVKKEYLPLLIHVARFTTAGQLTF